LVNLAVYITQKMAFTQRYQRGYKIQPKTKLSKTKSLAPKPRPGWAAALTVI